MLKMIHTRIPCKYFPEKHICVGKKYQIRKVEKGGGGLTWPKKKVQSVVVSHFCPNTPLNTGNNTYTKSSAVLAQLGLKALDLAWPEAASAFSNPRPGQSHQTRLGSGLAQPRSWLLYVK